ncbi:MAG: TonB-dependent receptor [Candidatus Cryptobacteroides sp.]|nr:TonB-dependent receptor [Candidatus Cryptobacteroides sp.]
MNKLFISTLCALLMCVSAFAQDVIKGVVRDASGPVSGVMVLDKNNGVWSTTDLDGNFTVTKAAKGHTLEFSCLGFTTVTLEWNGQNPLNVVINEDYEQLEETVVIGYGSVKKKDLTGSVGVLNGDIISQQSTSQLSQSLQGLMPGLQVSRTGSMPGASATIKVRGITTMSDSSPLILVDGMVVSSLDYVATEDVRQITVLKDAASASIYGARAASGVILITTKEASDGQLSVGYNGELSLITPTELPEFLTGVTEYMTMYNEWAWNDAGNPVGGEYASFSKDYIDNYFENNKYDPITYPNYDWKGTILNKTAPRHKHNLTMTYGNKDVKTRISASYEKVNALYEGSSHERISLRARNSIKFNDKLSGSMDFSFRHAIKEDPQSGSPLKAAYMYPSIYLGTYPDGRLGPGKEGSLSNTLAALREGGEKSTVADHISGKISLSYKPFEGFDITANLTPTFTFTGIKDMKKAVPIFDAYDTDLMLGYISGYNTNSLSEERRNSRALETQVTATYDKTFALKHNFNAMAGYEDYMYTYETVSAASDKMELATFPYLDLANINALTVGGNSYQNAYRSFFGRLMYNYDSRYYVQANVRADASSRFHKNHRWGYFPSVSMGWVVSNEKFMSSVKPVNYLKLRASLGSLGNERIGNYPYQTYISFSKAIMYDAAGKTPQSVMSGAQAGFAYQDIHWEKTWSWDLGIDATFLGNRLDLTADYYFKKTTDMLLDVAIPGFTGYTAPERNAGDMHTRGWEIKVGWHDKIGDFSYSVSANLSDYRSIMGNLNGKQVFNADGTIITEGEEYNSWYGYKSDGLFQSTEEIASSALLVSSVKPGDVKYVDVSGPDGEPDGIINQTHDRVSLGSSLPHFIYGGSVSLVWKGISFSMIFNGVGSQYSRLTESMIRPLQSQWLPAPAEMLNSDGSRNYWSVYNTAAENASVRYPRLSHQGGEYNNYKMSDFWLVNSSYMRIKNINLGYTFPKAMLSGTGISGLKVYLNVDDPICFDNYLKGWDPEAGASSYIARTFTIGVDLKF